MATINIELGKPNRNGDRKVYFLVLENDTKRRIPTTLFVSKTELSRNQKTIKDVSKAMIVENMRRELQDRLYQLSLEFLDADNDASYISDRIRRKRKQKDIDFFTFAEEWMQRQAIKGKKNYETFLNNLERHIGKRRLPLTSITYNMLSDYEMSLRATPRAMTLYLGAMRHIYREAMRQYNTDYEQVITNDPFMRYKVPRQQIKKGVRSLTLEELHKIYQYEGRPNSRAQLARDTFILSFCLMGMNSVDMYELKERVGNTLKYNRAKTKDRRSDGAYIEVNIHDFIQPLMRKYKGNKTVFNFSVKYASAPDFNRAINIGLKEVGEKIGIKGLQFYQARHTFATLSRNLMKFSKSDVDEALNHVGSMDIADIYIAKDFTIINENNFKLIEKVFEQYI